MVKSEKSLETPFHTGKEFFHKPSRAAAPYAAAPYGEGQRVSHTFSLMVPIRSIGPSHRSRIAAHLLALMPQDRYLRFGYAANDAQIQRYVEGLDFERDDIFGIFNRRLQLIAMAHLAFSTDPKRNSCAEFGVSVLAHARGRGYGARLFERAMIHARNDGVDMMFIHALSENKAMLKIARKAGALIERDGAESEAHLMLAPASLDSHMTEMFQEHMAQTDYNFKFQARQFRHFLTLLQDMRHGAQRNGEDSPH